MENKNNKEFLTNDGVEMKRRSTDELIDLWKSVFEGENKILREKMVYVGDEMKLVDYKILEEVKLRPVEDSAWLTWKRENGDIKMLIINDSFRSGVQINEKDEKSIILTHPGVDKMSGNKKETLRRYTALKQLI